MEEERLRETCMRDWEVVWCVRDDGTRWRIDGAGERP